MDTPGFYVIHLRRIGQELMRSSPIGTKLWREGRTLVDAAKQLETLAGLTTINVVTPKEERALLFGLGASFQNSEPMSGEFDGE